jgi:hypothetical protein
LRARRAIGAARRSVAAAALAAAAAMGTPAPAAEWPLPAVVEDAHYGEVLFYFYQEQYFPAIVRLLAAQERSRLEHHADEAELLLGGLYLSYGQHLEAADIFKRLLVGDVAPGVRDRTWFFLAKIRYQRAYPEAAERALANIEGELPAPLEAERQMLAAQLLIDSGRFDDAIARLQGWEGAPGWTSYARFNLGVALARSGRLADSTTVLDEAGKLTAGGEELDALKDKANLALGYTLLQGGQPLQAKVPLQRVRLSGPFSNKALLGAGWADAELGAWDRALVPWLELADRNLLDPAVQESLLAVPYAMAHLEASSQAADRYLRAINAFFDEAARIDRTIERIETGKLLEDFLAEDPRHASGWYWKMGELPDDVESRYLYHLLATHEFQEGLKNYRDLRFLANNLTDWQQRIGVFRNMLETRQYAYDQRLPRIEAALEEADLDRLVDHKLALDARLNGIEASGDSLALATGDEFRLWGEIALLERSPALSADIPEAAAARDKVRLLKGVLQWQLDEAFKARLWAARRDLRLAGEALVETHRARRSVDQAMREQPEVFAAFDRRVAMLAPRIEAILARVDAAERRQRAFLQAIAVEELEAQKQRLETYTVQARFALAAIYDRASAAGNPSP